MSWHDPTHQTPESEPDPLATCPRVSFDFERDGSTAGKLACVAHEVEQYLPHFCYIGSHGADVPGQLQMKSIVVLLNGGLKRKRRGQRTAGSVHRRVTDRAEVRSKAWFGNALPG